jgi:hypothetical protein
MRSSAAHVQLPAHLGDLPGDRQGFVQRVDVASTKPGELSEAERRVRSDVDERAVAFRNVRGDGVHLLGSRETHLGYLVGAGAAFHAG